MIKNDYGDEPCQAEPAPQPLLELYCPVLERKAGCFRVRFIEFLA